MKVLVADDHALIRDALGGVLRHIAADACVLEAVDGRQTMEMVELNPDIDLVLLDLNLPDRDGMSVLRDLSQSFPSVSVVVLSAFHDPSLVRRALGLGAVGFIPKATPRDVMVRALQLVISGGLYIPREILAPECASAPGSPATGDIKRLLPPGLGLTERQIEVLALMMQGKSNKAISRQLKVADSTVKNHVTAIFKALKVKSRTEAVIMVGKLGGEFPKPAGA